MLLNGIQVADRHNRPNANTTLGLRALFYNDGVLVDPVEILGVAIFRKTSNMFPETIFNNLGVIASEDTPVLNIAVLNVSAGASALLVNPIAAHDTAVNGFQTSDFSLGRAAGIYRVGVGDYVATIPVNSSGYYVSAAGVNYYDYLSRSDSTLAFLNSFILAIPSSIQVSSTSAVLNYPAEYIDVWVVKTQTGSTYQCFVNDFRIFNDTYTMLTEPPMVTVSNKLITKHVQYGEKIDIRISSEVALENKEISDAFQSIFKDSAIASASIEIKKVSNTPTVEAPFTVSSYANTSSTTQVTADNTIIFTWDTTGLPGIAAANTDFGPVKGTYQVRAKYSILNQVKITPPYYIIVS